jgi:acyl carrier protein
MCDVTRDRIDSKSDTVRDTILALLAAAHPLDFKKGRASVSTRLFEVGLVDSKGLLDIILEVETRCAVRFNPEHVDFEKAITLGSLIAAFDPVG